MFLERADEVRSQLECTLMAGEDRTHDGGPATASDALGSQQDSIVPSVTELFVILLSPKWSKALKRMCRQDGTLVRNSMPWHALQRSLLRCCWDPVASVQSSLLFVLHVRMYRTFPREELPAGAAELVRKFIRVSNLCEILGCSHDYNPFLCQNPAILPVLPMVVKNRLQTGLKTQTLVTSFDECEKVCTPSCNLFLCSAGCVIAAM